MNVQAAAGSCWKLSVRTIVPYVCYCGFCYSMYNAVLAAIAKTTPQQSLHIELSIDTR